MHVELSLDHNLLNTRILQYICKIW